MSIARTLTLVVLLTAAMFSYRYLSRQDVEPGVEAPPAAAEQVSESGSAMPVANPVPGVPVATQPDEPGCITFGQFREMPEVIADWARFEPLDVTGDTMLAYRSFNEATLQSYADQGDSGAMAIIGAMHVMRAYGLEDTMAIDWLAFEQEIDDLVNGKEPLSPAASLALNDAAFWFYQSALHGRLFTLRNYGQVRDRLFGGPVGLGWISQEDYDALDEQEKHHMGPSGLYERLAFDISPALQEGLLARILPVSPGSELEGETRMALAAEFQEALSDSGLPAIEVAPSQSIEIEGLSNRLCDFGQSAE